MSKDFENDSDNINSDLNELEGVSGSSLPDESHSDTPLPEAGGLTPDSVDLGFTEAGAIVIGYVDEIHGRGARECPQFVPTEHELVELVKYWHRQIVESWLEWFYSGMTSSSGSQTVAYAYQRVARIRDAVGEAATGAACSLVDDEFRERIGDEHWRIFVNGTDEEVKRIQAEFMSSFTKG